MAKLRIFIFSMVLIQLFLAPGSVSADTGPKPSMEFDFKYDSEVQQVTILSGILYECNQRDCSDAEPLAEIGPQGLYCEPRDCRAIGYGFAPYHRLEIEFSDGVVRRSNIFETAGFDSKYTVTVSPAALLVEAQFSLGFLPRTGTALLLVGCLCALAVGGLVAGLVVFIRRRPASA